MFYTKKKFIKVTKISFYLEFLIAHSRNKYANRKAHIEAPHTVISNVISFYSVYNNGIFFIYVSMIQYLLNILWGRALPPCALLVSHILRIRVKRKVYSFTWNFVEKLQNIRNLYVLIIFPFLWINWERNVCETFMLIDACTIHY